MLLKLIRCFNSMLRLLWLLTRKKIPIENKMPVPHNEFQGISNQIDPKY